MSQFSWKIDLDRCVGCNACTVACKSENNTNPTDSTKSGGVNWRWVVTQKKGAYSDSNSSYSETYITMSCMHCKDPACLLACPLTPKAITKDANTGIVTIDNTKCVGCKRCNWVCPYGAPRYNQNTKKSEKCTACSHKLYQKADGTWAYTTPPACVSTCAGRALKYEILTTPLTGTVGTPPDNFADPKHTNPQIDFSKITY